MKFVVPLVCLFSLPALADLNCKDLNSSLSVKYLVRDSIQVTFIKDGKIKIMPGYLKPQPPLPYFNVSEYNVFDGKNAPLTLKVTSQQTNSHPCGRCTIQIERPVTWSYSAELSYQGQDLTYSCIKDKQ